MKEVTSVLEFANAAAIERINYELVKVIENIQNPNTDEKPRKLTVELCLTPVNNRTTVNIKTTVKKQLRLETDTSRDYETLSQQMRINAVDGDQAEPYDSARDV